MLKTGFLFLLFLTQTSVLTTSLSPVQQMAMHLIQECIINSGKYNPALKNLTRCSVHFDSACWPETRGGQNATIPCPSLFYYDSANATRHCNSSTGKWERTRYDVYCKKLPADIANAKFLKLAKRFNITVKAAIPPVDPHLKNQLYLYVIMQWISLAIMIPAVLILLIFTSLSNERIQMHVQLIFAFIMSVITFLVEYYLALSVDNQTACNAFWILNRYFAVAEVTWMLNEGVYLMKILLFVFSERTFAIAFVVFGWGFPALLTVGIWLPVMIHSHGDITKRCWINDAHSNIMLIIYVPMTTMLVINLIILINVIRLLISKLRDTRTSDFETAKKAAKGTVVLMPLLGMIYLMIFYAPKGVVWYDYLLRVVQPLQGILVCIVHVYLSKEVIACIRNKIRKLFAQHTLIFPVSSPDTLFRAPLQTNRKTKKIQSKEIFTTSTKLNRIWFSMKPSKIHPLKPQQHVDTTV